MSDRKRFPLDALPHPMMADITYLSDARGYPYDFLACSFLVAASSAIGNSIRYRSDSYTGSCALFMALVGEPSSGKSEAISQAYAPLRSLQILHDRQYYTDLKKHQDDAKINKEPQPKLLYVDDITVEKLADMMKLNPRGISIMTEELATWIYSVNGKYKTASDAPTWIKIWDNSDFRVSRKSSGYTAVSNSFSSVLGGVQPGILESLFHGNEDNGFMARVLFCYPDDGRNRKRMTEKLMQHFRRSEIRWENVIKNLYGYGCESEECEFLPYHIEFSNSASEMLLKFQIENDRLREDAEYMGIKTAFSKLDIYVCRIALLLCLLELAYAKELDTVVIGNAIVSESNFKNAIAIVEYFRSQIIRVQGVKSGMDLSASLSGKKLDFYKDLPASFTFSAAVKMGNEKHGLSTRTIKRILSDGNVFRKEKRGKYVKIENIEDVYDITDVNVLRKKDRIMNLHEKTVDIVSETFAQKLETL